MVNSNTIDKLLETKVLRRKIAQRQQEQAADPKLSVWVEASAGTGKTKVLSDRVLRLLLDGVNPSKILCLTYTKAAAVEMNSRISARLGKWAVMSEQGLNDELKSLLGYIADEKLFTEISARARTLFATILEVSGGMKIQTIHSFCQEILKRFPLEAGISPYFTVMDDRMAAEALDAICQSLIMKIEHEPDTDSGQAIAYLTRHIREFRFPELLRTLMAERHKLWTMFAAYPDFGAFIRALRQKLNITETETEDSAIQSFVRQIDTDRLQKAKAALAQSTKTDVKKAQSLSAVENQFDYEIYKSAFLTQKGEPYAVFACKDAVKAYPEILDFMQSEAERLMELEHHLLQLRLFASTKAVMRIASDLIVDYQAYKRKNARLDYEDLIMLTRRLLENKSVAQWVLFKLDGGISHVLIDEAQDTSPDQWAIVKAVTDEFFSGSGQTAENRTVFAVGDRKQSIYSFQGADPEEFDRMRQLFSARTADFQTIRLDVSFRSTSAVLETVNNLFALPEAKPGVVLDDEAVEHLPFRLGEGGRVEIWPLIEAEDEKNDEVWYPPIERTSQTSAATLLARQIAQKIKQMVDSGQMLESKKRPLRYNDFMILVQRRNAFVEELVRECKRYDVAVSGVDKLKLLQQIAVRDLISLGKFLLLPNDDLSLAEVLKSPLFGLDDDDLFKLCHNRGTTSLWNRLRENPNYAAPAQILTDLLQKADYFRPFELYNYILTSLKGRENFLSRLGHEAEDAIDEFVNLTLSFEENHIPALQNFMEWVAADEVEIKRELDQPDLNAVRIMTVHGSKGLQAPVVILPDTIRLANVKKSADLLWGNGNLAYYPLSSAGYDQTCDEIFNQEKQKAFDEYRRLLYVALTRAEDQLYICGFKPKKDISEQSWYALCRSALAQHGEKAEDNSYTYVSAQEFEVKTEEKTQAKLQIFAEKPSWLNLPAPSESPLAKPYMPSHAEDDLAAASSPLYESGQYFRRGVLIHRLLQFLPPTGDEHIRAKAINVFLQKNAADMSPAAIAQIKNEILKLLSQEKFAFIFGNDSQAEVPVMGKVDEKIVSAQIDRLIVTDEKVVIVDFKTNRPAASTVADVPPAYINQLKIYKQLLQQIYPGRPVETYILWTNTATLMPIN